MKGIAFANWKNSRLVVFYTHLAHVHKSLHTRLVSVPVNRQSICVSNSSVEVLTSLLRARSEGKPNMFPFTSTFFCFGRVLSVPRGVVGSLEMMFSLQLVRQNTTPFGCFAPELKYLFFLCAVTEQSSGMNIAVVDPWTILERFRSLSKQHSFFNTSSNRHQKNDTRVTSCDQQPSFAFLFGYRIGHRRLYDLRSYLPRLLRSFILMGV